MVSLTADMSPLHPDRNLALELVRATEAAAIRAVPFIGRGDKLAADAAAVIVEVEPQAHRTCRHPCVAGYVELVPGALRDDIVQGRSATFQSEAPAAKPAPGRHQHALSACFGNDDVDDHAE